MDISIVKVYITFNLIIRFYELKCPGKEIIKAIPRGPRHNNLPPLVALTMGAILTSLPIDVGLCDAGQINKPTLQT